jgi:hypothetical protein
MNWLMCWVSMSRSYVRVDDAELEDSRRLGVDAETVVAGTTPSTRVRRSRRESGHRPSPVHGRGRLCRRGGGQTHSVALIGGFP